MKKRILLVVISLVIFSLACLSTAGGPRLDAESSAGTSPTLTNVLDSLTPPLSHEGEGEIVGESCAVVVAESALHLRGGSSEKDIVLTWLRSGDVVGLISTSDPDWWLVSFNGGAGYARSSYLEESECAE